MKELLCNTRREDCSRQQLVCAGGKRGEGRGGTGGERMLLAIDVIV